MARPGSDPPDQPGPAEHAVAGVVEPGAVLGHLDGHERTGGGVEARSPVLRRDVEPVEAHVASHLREPGSVVGFQLAGIRVEVGLQGDDLALDEASNRLDDQRLLVAHGEIHAASPCFGARC
nr:hypothetical protein [Candidatus Poriferisodalis multihospitum]